MFRDGPINAVEDEGIHPRSARLPSNFRNPEIGETCLPCISFEELFPNN